MPEKTPVDFWFDPSALGRDDVALDAGSGEGP